VLGAPFVAPASLSFCSLQAFRGPLIAGLVSSVGGITEAVVKHSEQSLTAWFGLKSAT
jgi:hypothetical protein